MKNATATRGVIQSRVVWIVCGVIVVILGCHHFLLRGYIDERFDRFIAKCCNAPCPPPKKNFEPPYFAGFRLHNSASNPGHVVEEVHVEVKKDLPDGGLWSAISPNAFEPPPPPHSPSIPPMGIWMPLGNNDPEPIWGVRVLVKIQGEDDYRVVLVEGLNGKPDAQVDVVIEEMTWIDDEGNPVTELVVRMWVWSDFADGMPKVAYGDSRP